MELSQDPEATWAQCIVKHFAERDGEVKIHLRDPVATIGSIEQLAQALMTYYNEHAIPEPNLMALLKQIEGAAGDAFEWLTDEGDHG